MKKQKHSLTTWGLMGAVGLAVASVTMPANADEMMHKGHRLLLKSAVENADFTDPCRTDARHTEAIVAEDTLRVSFF